MKRAWMVAGLVSASWGLLACEEVTPTSTDGGLLPLEPRTVEVVLSFEEFAEQIQVYGGYGTPSEVFESVLADDFEGVLDSRVLSRYSTFPWRASIRDSTGTLRADSGFTFTGGYLVARFDTADTNLPTGSVIVGAQALPASFDPPTASWTVAVDTINDYRLWDEAGAGGGMDFGEATWTPTSGDSVVFALDSAQVALLGDTTEVGDGVRFDLRSAGERINLIDTDLRLFVRPNHHQDTIVTLSAPGTVRTFIYDPVPLPAADGIRVGGAPSWRTVMTLDLPGTVDASGGALALTRDRINSATIELTTAPSEPAFQPSDSIFLDARPVLAPELLPKSPLGSSLIGGLGVSIAPGSFGESPRTVSIPVTSFVRALVDDSVAAADKVRDVVFLTPIEPLSIGFGSFQGPGSASAPTLRLILTVSDTVEVR
ncbi:hypothetical protein V3331_07820 [Gaopeijia maritima]|uniref:hypothetical protein n=1 Tax=Gaopeijia maritima TaxID=3119007 RepID=UPI0032434361